MKLSSSRLHVEIEDPGQRYRGTRFDWTSLVSSVILDRQHECLSQEMAPGEFAAERGFGLMCEFGIRMPVGYDDCPVDEWFTKIGIGWIRRENDGDYDFFRTYPEFEVAAHTLTKTTQPEGDSLELVMDSGIRRGYGWKLTRLWTVRDNQLACRTTLVNAGTKPLVTNEYCHNFLQPQALPTSGLRPAPLPRHLDLSWGEPLLPEVLVNPESVLALGRGGVDINPLLTGEFYASYLGRDLPAGSSWQLSVAGLPWIREQVDCAVSHCDLWGKQYAVSPELFVPLSLAPGASLTWQRTHTFGA